MGQLNASIPTEVRPCAWWLFCSNWLWFQHSPPLDKDNENLSLAERRPCRLNCQLPKQFKDIVPQPLPLLPPASDGPTVSWSTSPIPSLSPSDLTPSSPNPVSSPRRLGSRICQIFWTPQNIFGLIRQYCSDRLPSHDPEEHVDLQDLSDNPIAADEALPTSQSQQGPSTFYPYPNQSSFLLGDWYWNHGVQKSRESFNELLNIVGSPNFHADDVQHTKWAKIDSKLARNNFDENGAIDREEEDEWMDDGWHCTPLEANPDWW